MNRSLIALFLCCGCTRAEPLRIFTAASMEEPMHDLFGREATLNAAASSALARQIESGATADLFVSADEAWADYVIEHATSLGKKVVAHNRLVLIASSGDSRSAEQLLDLRIALADPSHVPAGKYAQAALQKMGRWKETFAAAADVRAALALVERGEADAAVVYRTDALLSKKVRVVSELECPIPIEYFAVLLSERGRPLFDRLGSEEGKEDLRPLRLRAMIEIVLLSLGVAAGALVLVLPSAIALAWFLAHHRFPGKGVIEGIASAPLVLPPVVTGYLLLIVLGRRGIIGGPLHDWFGIDFTFRASGAAIAAAVVAFPLALRAIRQSFEAIDTRLFEAAKSLGASPWSLFVRIGLPLAFPGILSGALLSFARSLGEFGATVTFAGNVAGETRTLPLAIYAALQRPDGDAIAARMVALSMALAFAALIGGELLARKRS